MRHCRRNVAQQAQCSQGQEGLETCTRAWEASLQSAAASSGELDLLSLQLKRRCRGKDENWVCSHVFLHRCEQSRGEEEETGAGWSWGGLGM